MNDVFLVICTGYFGDVLLTAKLTRDIKKYYPTSKVVYICDSPYYSVAKNIPGVDEVFPYDRKMGTNLFKYLKFLLSFPYRTNVKHAFIIHQNKKSRELLAKLLGAKTLTTWDSFKSKEIYGQILQENPEHSHVAYFNADMLADLTDRITDDEDIEFLINEETNQKINLLLSGYESKTLIAVNPQATDESKCWDPKEFANFIKMLIHKGQMPVLTGLSKDGRKFIEELENDTNIAKSDYINMMDKTNFAELGALYKKCSFVVSIDTGSAHMACAVGTSTLVLFFREDAHLWSPINTLKNSFIYGKSITADEVMNKMSQMTNLVL